MKKSSSLFRTSTPEPPIEKPRMIFSFGAQEDTYFIGCGEAMEWNGLPEDLEHILRNRALEVLALALGENDAFYCRYIAKRNRTEYTVTGNLPSRLEFLLNAWWANQYEVPHIAFGPYGSYFFQLSSMTAWEHLPKRLEESLMDLRDSPEITMPPRSVALGWDGGFVFLTGDEGEYASWDGVDVELAEKLQALVGDEKRVVENAVLSLANSEDYILTFSDGSIFYSVPDTMIPAVQRFVKIYHAALVRYAEVHPYPEHIGGGGGGGGMAGVGGMEGCGEQFSLELPDGILGWSEDGISKFIESAVAARSPTAGDGSSPGSTPPEHSPRMGKRRSHPSSKGIKIPTSRRGRQERSGLAGRRGMGGAVDNIKTGPCRGGWCGCSPQERDRDREMGYVSGRDHFKQIGAGVIEL